MRLLIVEDFTSGALSRDTPGWNSLIAEGTAMLRAMTQDAVAIPNGRIEVFWSEHLGEFPIPNTHVHRIGSECEETRRFAEVARQVDRVLVIAPESGGRLQHRRNEVDAVGGQFIGGSAEALALCADKLQLAAHLQKAGLSVISTQCVTIQDDPPTPPTSSGWVVKPRDGAGSVLTFHVRDADAWRRAVDEITQAGFEVIHQPYIPGVSLSMAGIISRYGLEIFPLATQEIARRQETLSYEGGTLGPLLANSPREQSIAQAAGQLVRETLTSIPGLAGYVGVDLILPHDSATPIVVEINPRLTTSYLGYRRLARQNLAPRVLDPEGFHPPLDWHPDRVIRFGPRVSEW